MKAKIFNKLIPEKTRQLFIPIYCQHPSTMKLRSNGITLSGISRTTPGFQIHRSLDGHLVLFTLAGKGEFISGGKKIILERGSVLLAPAFHEHFYQHCGTREWRILWFHLEPSVRWNFLNIQEEVCGRSNDSTFIESAMKSLILEVFSLRHELMDKIGPVNMYWDCYDLESAINRFGLSVLPARLHASELAESCGNTILMYLERELSELLGYKQRSEAHLFLDRLWEKININLEREWSLKDMAAEVNMSIPTFIRQVKHIYQSTPSNVLQHIRIRQASILVADTRMPVSRIAEEVGYTNTSSFINVFKKYFNCTPLKYREQHQNSPA